MRFMAALFSLLAIGVLALAGAFVVAQSRLSAPGPLTAPTIVELPRGEGASAIARRLAAAGAVSDAWLFRLGARLAGAEGGLKAGEYELPAAASIREIIEMMREGRVLKRKITIAEGLSVKQALALIAAAPALEGEPPAAIPEGMIAPETYFYVKGESRAEVAARMTAAQKTLLETLWPDRAPDLPITTPEEALALASIVEKETAVAEERPRVAAVFINRLRKGMKLQSDPTTIYGLAKGDELDRPLTRADLAAETPWNTYVIPALPPTPIANPGRASIEAVLHPATTKDLYFVADGSGGHAFAETLERHNANVARWRELEKTRAKEAPK